MNRYPENGSTAESWWTAYNKLKHDRLQKLHVATLGNALNMLAAAFILHKVAEAPTTFNFLGEKRTENFRDPDAWIRIEKEIVLRHLRTVTATVQAIPSPTQITSDLFEQVIYFRPIRPDRRGT